jgi:hypothetical protein
MSLSFRHCLYHSLPHNFFISWGQNPHHRTAGGVPSQELPDGLEALHTVDEALMSRAHCVAMKVGMGCAGCRWMDGLSMGFIWIGINMGFIWINRVFKSWGWSCGEMD